MEFVVRGIGLVKFQRDLENIVLQLNHGTPVYLKGRGAHPVGRAIFGAARWTWTAAGSWAAWS